MSDRLPDYDVASIAAGYLAREAEAVSLAIEVRESRAAFARMRALLARAGTGFEFTSGPTLAAEIERVLDGRSEHPDHDVARRP